MGKVTAGKKNILLLIIEVYLGSRHKPPPDTHHQQRRGCVGWPSERVFTISGVYLSRQTPVCRQISQRPQPNHGRPIGGEMVAGICGWPATVEMRSPRPFLAHEVGGDSAVSIEETSGWLGTGFPQVILCSEPNQ